VARPAEGCLGAPRRAVLRSGHASVVGRTVLGAFGRDVGEAVDGDGGPVGRHTRAELAEMHRLAAEATRDMILIGRPGSPEWVSPSVTELLGHTPEEFLSVGLYSLIHPDDLDAVVGVRLPAAVGEEIGGRCRIRHADGTYRWMEARARPLPDADGTFTNRSISSWRNVDREVAALAELQASEQRYRLLVDHVTDGVILERDGVIEWASPNLYGMLGWNPDLWVGLRILDIVRPELQPPLEQALALNALAVNQTLRFELPAADGTLHWLEFKTRPFIDAEGRRDGTALSVRLIDAEVAAERALEHRARHDQLTGLFNRNEIIERLDAIGSDGRRAGAESAVLFCDLDGFKTVNDTHGHAVGDLVLKEVADRVRGTIRDDDLVARIGGDELLVVLHHLHGVDEALSVADDIRRATSRPIASPAGALSVTMSIGVTMVHKGDTADDVIARADEAMYRAKQAGRDGVQQLPLDL
jgi:diguanylate cyclase (GGDEF)-like protein/PAS domain S-box-containing protein